MAREVRLVAARLLSKDDLEESVLSYVRENARIGPVLRDLDTDRIQPPTFVDDKNSVPGRRARRDATSDIIGDVSPGGKLAIQFRAKNVVVPFAQSIPEELAKILEQTAETVTSAPRPGHVVPGSIPNAQSALLTADLTEIFFEGSPGDQPQIPVLRIISDQPKGDTKVQVFTTDFLLQDVSETRAEKYQIFDTFGRSFIFFFGKRPEIYTYSGVLLNSKNFDWMRRFIALYENRLRGTKAVEGKVRAQISYEDVVREGYILGTNINLSQSYLRYSLFSFTMFVTRAIFIGDRVRDPSEIEAIINEPQPEPPVQADFEDDLQPVTVDARGRAVITEAKKADEGVVSVPAQPVGTGPRLIGPDFPQT